MQTINELQLAKELIRYPSITPIDAGVMKFLEKQLRKLGFKTKILEFKEKNTKTRKNISDLNEDKKSSKENKKLLAKSEKVKEPKALKKAIPSNFRSPYWFGIAKRARVIYYNPSRTNPPSDLSYEDLADHKYKGKVVIRKSNNVYNQSLSLIHI